MSGSNPARNCFSFFRPVSRNIYEQFKCFWLPRQTALSGLNCERQQTSFVGISGMLQEYYREPSLFFFCFVYLSDFILVLNFDNALDIFQMRPGRLIFQAKLTPEKRSFSTFKLINCCSIHPLNLLICGNQDEQAQHLS